jgi:cytochrome b
VLVWHRWNGLAVLVLLVWRILWGFAGSSTARFASFLAGPGAMRAYAVGLLGGRPRRYLGHNPLGAAMILLLLGLALLQGGLGLFTVEHNDLTAGPLYRLVSEEAQKLATSWHRWLFYWVLLPLAGVHVAANVLYGIFKKEPLVAAMVTGVKPRDSYADVARAEIVPRPLLRAAVCLLAAAAIVLGSILALGGKLP